VTAKFAVNNKIHSTTKMFPFIVNYSRKLRMEVDIRRKRKSREADRVCRKNEKYLERGWSSIEKNSGRNEVTSR